MWNPYNPQNPYQAQSPYQPPQRGEIIKVNGRGGAEAFQLMPNSSILLLDANDPIVWLKTTDGAGYPTLIPYTITPYQQPPEITNADLLVRIEKLEEMLNAKPDFANAGQPEPAGEAR